MMQRRDRGVPSDMADLHERLRRSLATSVDADEVWAKVSAGIDAETVVPFGPRRKRRFTALLVAATLTLGGSALAAVGATLDADHPAPELPATDDRPADAAIPPVGNDGSDPSGAAHSPSPAGDGDDRDGSDGTTEDDQGQDESQDAEDDDSGTAGTDDDDGGDDADGGSGEGDDDPSSGDDREDSSDGAGGDQE